MIRYAKKWFSAVVFAVLFVSAAAAQEIDISGTYVVRTEDGIYRIDVEADRGVNTFYFMTHESNVFLLPLYRDPDGDYVYQSSKGETIRIGINGYICSIRDVYDDNSYVKYSGSLDTIDGIYRPSGYLPPAEESDYVEDYYLYEVIVHSTAPQPQIKVRLWSYDMIKTYQQERDMTYSINVDDWDRFTLTFEEDGCVLTDENGIEFILEKEVRENRNYFLR